MAKVMLIGIGDLGTRLADGLDRLDDVHELVLCGRSVPGTRSGRVRAERLDAWDTGAVADLLRAERPDLVVMCASPRSPWSLLGRTDRAARIVSDAGFGVRLPYLLGLPWSLMRAVREADYHGPVANLSYPDVTGPVLAARGLAPTLGLGNVGMLLVRARQAAREAEPVRVVAHHAQVAGAMRGERPSVATAWPRTYVGEGGRRDDDLPYRPAPLEPGPSFNAVTASAALPVLRALLPGADPLRWSVPAPHGRPGGYPVRIAGGEVRLDLPPGLSEQEAVELNCGWARGDGVERIAGDGTVYFTADVHRAVAELDPELAAPLSLEDVPPRMDRLNYYLNGSQHAA